VQVDDAGAPKDDLLARHAPDSLQRSTPDNLPSYNGLGCHSTPPTPWNNLTMARPKTRCRNRGTELQAKAAN
jgi:hypothetical protein